MNLAHIYVPAVECADCGALVRLSSPYDTALPPGWRWDERPLSSDSLLEERRQGSGITTCRSIVCGPCGRVARLCAFVEKVASRGEVE